MTHHLLYKKEEETKKPLMKVKDMKKLAKARQLKSQYGTVISGDTLFMQPEVKT